MRTPPLARILALAALILVMLPGSSGAQGTNANLADDRQVFLSLDELTAEKAPGIAILVSRNGEVLYEEGFGYASLEQSMPVTVDTQFRIGSITKQFTAAAILRLREDDKIGLNDPLSDYFPDFPRAEEVTIYQLLTHTSGIRSYTNHPHFALRVAYGIEPGALVDSIKGYGFEFDPGTAQSYNNSGYFLLGLIVEKASGTSLEKYLKTTFFDPLGMKDTGMYSRENSLRNEALGYSLVRGKFEAAHQWHLSWAGGSGAMVSTVRDLYQWNEALFGGDVLLPESLKFAFAPARLRDGSLADGIALPYGFGWTIGEYRGQRELAHGGGIHGFLSYLARYPESDLTVVALANCSPFCGVNPERVVRELAAQFLPGSLDLEVRLPSFE